MLDTLVYSIYDCIKAMKNLIYKVPKYCEYKTDDKAYYGNSLSIPIGEGAKGTVYLNINQSCPHTYLVGTTGSGKSNLLKVILSTVINNYPNISLVLCDYKRCELSMFANCNNVISFSYTEEAISNTINNLYQQVLDKYDKLMKENRYQCSPYEETILLVIEEVALMDKATMATLKKLLSISRATNTYCIFTLQRPDCTVLNPIIKSLVANRIVLRVEDVKNSIIALDCKGAELLRGNGHGIIKSNGYKIEFQGAFLKDEVLNQIVKANSKAEVVKENSKEKVQIETSVQNSKAKDNETSSTTCETSSTTCETSWLENL